MASGFVAMEQEKRQSFWRFLYHPMLAMSLLLHGVVLALPMAPDTPVEEPEPEETVELTQLPPVINLTAPAAPKPVQPVPRPSPIQRTAAPAPVDRPRTNPVPNPEPTPSPEPSPSASAEPSPTPSSIPSPNVSPAPVETPAPLAFDPQAPRQQFLDNLQGVQGNIGLQPFPGVFDDPLQFYTSDASDAPLVPGIASMQWFNDMRAEEAFTSIEQTYGQQGITFADIGEYGGGRVYAMNNGEGQTFGYLNLVPGKGGASTVVVTWEFDPNSPPPETTGQL